MVTEALAGSGLYQDHKVEGWGMLDDSIYETSYKRWGVLLLLNLAKLGIVCSVDQSASVTRVATSNTAI